MNDESIIRIVAIIAGTAIVVVSSFTGIDGLMRSMAGILIGFGVGVGFGRVTSGSRQ